VFLPLPPPQVNSISPFLITHLLHHATHSSFNSHSVSRTSAAGRAPRSYTFIPAKARTRSVCIGALLVADQTPLLWNEIDIIGDRTSCLRFLTREAQAAFAKNAHFVQRLRTVYFPVIQSLLHQVLATNSSSDPAAASSTLSAVSTSCTNLEHLDFRGIWRDPLPLNTIFKIYAQRSAGTNPLHHSYHMKNQYFV
jgi:hypothetical protein